VTEKCACFDAPRIQQVSDEPAHVVNLLVDDTLELAHLGRVEIRRLFQQGDSRALDGGERRAQLVAHQAEELGTQPLELLQRCQVLHGDHDRDDLAVVGMNRGRIEEHGDAATVRDREHDLFGAHRLFDAQQLRDGELAQGLLAAVGASEDHQMQQLFHRAARRAQTLHDSPRFEVERHRATRSGVEHYDADRRGLDQSLQIGAGTLFLPVRARVGDRYRRLRGKQQQYLLVLVGKLGRPLLIGEEEAAHVNASMTNRGALEGSGLNQFGREPELTDVGRQVRDPDRSRQVAQVCEQPAPVPPLDVLALHIGGDAGRDELANLARLDDGSNDPVAGVG